jgi:two-component system, chemotaxis family, CheB/CheR fusion protein
MAKSDNSKKSRKAATAPAPAPAASPKANNKNFPVVAVGASAGGLEAFTELLKALPEKPGMAFVLVPHLDPTHASAMTELLSRTTKLAVLQVQHGMRVKPDHVYVIPPNTEMTIASGMLQLETRARGHQYMPIDVFMRSLAEDRGSNAIGVVLSGTASDGTLGLTAIKGAGGITFAQDSKSAKYDGMPNSAAASGCVDFVMPPARIAAEMGQLREHPYISSGDGEQADVIAAEDSYDLHHLFRILKQVSGVDFSDYKPGTVRRRILRRMALNKIEKLTNYIAYLREHRGEAEALYQDILINVTSFFRNPEAFDSLKQMAYPLLLKDRQPNDTIRVWVPGCSTGEEAYSHAISLVEYLSDVRADFSVQIFGTDLSEAAIQNARAGIYKQSIAADVPPVRLRRFFNKVEEGYQISKAIRDCCIFARQNVFQDPLFSRMDIVSCRNLLIYLGPALQKRVVPIFHYALRPNGFLMVGNTEGLVGSGAELFEMADKKHKIYSKKPVASPVSFGLTLDRLEIHGKETPAALKEHEAPKPPTDVQKEADRLLLAKYVPPAVVINEHMDILQTRGHTGRYLELSPGKASLNLMKMARPGLMYELQKAFEAARKSGNPVRKEDVQVESNGDLKQVSVEVVPLKAVNSPQSYMIIFEDDRSEPARHSATARRKSAKSKADGNADSALQRDRQIAQLKQELAATKEYLQSIIEEREATNEELQSANEEIQSANEELQSTNEELQTSKEELESANEELNTVNEEMQHRNAQLGQLNNDLVNLLNSVNIPIVMLGQDLSVRRFTPQAEKVLGLSAVDVGRSISNIRLKIDVGYLEQAVLDVLRDIIPKQQQVKDEGGNSYTLRITPYRTSDNKIDGAVVTLLA